MRIGEVKGMLNICPWQPKLLIGPPGIGKTQVVHQFAKEIGRKCYTIPLAHFRPEDLSGIPFVKPDGTFAVSRPLNIPGEEEEAIVFFDEITCVNNEVVSIALKAIDEQIIGWFRFSNCYVVAAGNSVEWGGNLLDERLLSRFQIYKIEADVNDLIDYFAQREDYRGTPGLSFVTAFLLRNPHFLIKRGREGEIFPTPRGWEKALNVINAIGIDSNNVIEHIGSCIGEENAATFVKFCRLVDTFAVTDNVLQGKKTDFSTDKLDVAYLITSSLATRTKSEQQAEYSLNFIQHQLIKGEVPKDLILLYLKLLIPKKINVEKLANYVPSEIWLQIGKLMDMK
jgi:DNA polymerase III delta prime subunit